MARFMSLTALTLLVVTMLSVSAEVQLSASFYAKTCPQVEEIVYREMARVTQQKKLLPADFSASTFTTASSA